MPRPANPVPAYAHHKGTNQAYVRIPNGKGGRKCLYLGKYGSPESREAFSQIVARLSVGSPATAHPIHPPTPAADITVNEALLRYVHHVRGYYPANSARNHLDAIRPVKSQVGALLLSEFTPRLFKAIRQTLIDSGKLARGTINNRMALVAQFIKWCVAEEMVDPACYGAIRAVPRLAKGRSAAGESDPVEPVADDVVSATLPFLNRHVAGMVRFQRLTGCRPGEVCILRWADIDKSDPTVWVYRPEKHKLSYRGIDRVIPIGPQAQAVLAAFPADDPTDFVFSPARASAEHLAARSARRRTKRWASHMKRNKSKRIAFRKRPPGKRYTAKSYGDAVDRACDRAFPPTGKLGRRSDESNAKWWARLMPEQRDEVKRWQKAHRWAPNQLRHAAATQAWREYGPEAAQHILGHRHLRTTEIYAEKNSALARRVAAAMG